MTAAAANVRIINELKVSRRVLHSAATRKRAGLGTPNPPRDPRRMPTDESGKREDDAFSQGGGVVVVRGGASWSIRGGFQLCVWLNYACLLG